MKRLNYSVLTLILITLFFSVTPVFAKKTPPPPPVVIVVSRWTPQEQLVSTSAPVDTRTVNLQMSARSDRQFWAMDISCLVSQTGVFESTGQTITWASGWSQDNDDNPGNDTDNYQDITEAIPLPYYNIANNRINASITRVGASNAPVGLNGTTYTEFLFNLELTLTEGVGTKTISITCDKLLFLDRNGASLGDTTLSNTNNLTVRDGYVISGFATRQGNNDKGSIEVSCEHLATTNVYTVVTQNLNVFDGNGVLINQPGLFSFSNAFESSNPLRDFGLYKCTHTSKFGGSDDTVYLNGISYINLQTPDYTLQPITLRTGDTAPNDIIDINDFPAITGNWQNSVATPFTEGDVNGDSFANEIDLAITAGNVGLANISGGVLMDHVVYSVARDYNDTFPNNSLVMGDVFSGDVSSLNGDRAFWPQVSPNGSQIAYYAESTYLVDKKGKVTTNPKKAAQTMIEEGIFVGNTSDWDGSLIANGKNFAPSWSPSGGQIAYACSWDADLDPTYSGYQYNNSDICVVDASSGTVQTIGTDSEIFPPAWYDDTTLVYAGNPDNAICPKELCYYDMLTNTHGILDFTFGVDGATSFANMPVIIRKSDTLSYLFYRRFTDSESELRMGEIAYNSGTGVWSGGVLTTDININDTHRRIDTTDDSEKDIHYYDVSPMLDVMYYGFGDYQFHNLYFADGASFSWSSGEDHIVDGFIGYSTASLFSGIWDGTEEDETDFHAFKATFDWLP